MESLHRTGCLHAFLWRRSSVRGRKLLAKRTRNGKKIKRTDSPPKLTKVIVFFEKKKANCFRLIFGEIVGYSNEIHRKVPIFAQHFPSDRRKSHATGTPTRVLGGTPNNQLVLLHYTPFPRRRPGRKKMESNTTPPPSSKRDLIFLDNPILLDWGGGGGAWRGGEEVLRNYRRFSLNLHFMHAGMGMVDLAHHPQKEEFHTFIIWCPEWI